MAPPVSAQRRPPAFQADKFRELVLYIARRCENDETFAATKLNKLLYYSDFRAFARFGAPITGATYQKIKWGPAPRQYLPVINEMVASGEAEVRKVDYHRRVQDRLIALKDADPDVFAPRELALVDEVIEEFWGRSARAISDESHKQSGWRLAEFGDTIPYWSILIDLDHKPTDTDREWARRMASDPRAAELQ
jgi:uncharacterized phage-associated protein